MINIALVGARGYGWELIEQIREASSEVNCRLVAVADDRLSDVADKVDALKNWDVSIFSDAMEMFDRLKGRCEIVYIATGISSHLSLASAAMAAGYHVHLEKPAAATVQEADALAEACRRNAKMCLVGFQSMHSSEVRQLQQRLADGEFGQVRSISCWAAWPRGRNYYGRNNWAGRLRCGGHWVLDGPATNALAHQLTNMLFWASGVAGKVAQPTAVRAEMYAANPLVDGHDTAAIEMETPGGAKVYFLGSHSTAQRTQPLTTIIADKARIVWGYSTGCQIHHSDGRIEKLEHDRRQRFRMVENLVEAVRHDKPEIIRCGPDEARGQVLAVNGAYESAGQVARIDPSHCHTIDAGSENERVAVEGMESILQACATQLVLPSQLVGPPAWARAGERFDMTGYRQFPQRFNG